MSEDPDEILKTCPKCHKQDRTSFSTCRYCSAPYVPHLAPTEPPSLIEQIYNVNKQTVVVVFVLVSILCYFYVRQTMGSSSSNMPSRMIWGTRSGNLPAIPAAFVAFFGGRVMENAAHTIESSTETLEKHPGDYAALVARGDGYWTEGDMANAMTDYSSAINAKPDIPEAYEKRALIYDAMGEYDKSKKDRDTAEVLKKH